MTTTRSFKTGERIISKGAPAETAYLIESGQVRVFLENEGKIVDLATLGPQQIFGEAALIRGSLYGAHVDALEDTTLSLITPEILATKMQACDPMIRALVHMLIHRLSKTNEALLKSETRGYIDVVFV